jgi:hypothetical protein
VKTLVSLLPIVNGAAGLKLGLKLMEKFWLTPCKVGVSLNTCEARAVFVIVTNTLPPEDPKRPSALDGKGGITETEICKVPGWDQTIVAVKRRQSTKKYLLIAGVF